MVSVKVRYADILTPYRLSDPEREARRIAQIMIDYRYPMPIVKSLTRPMAKKAIRV
jgi:hypothetical protein